MRETTVGVGLMAEALVYVPHQEVGVPFSYE